MTLRLAISGASGRMGRMLVDATLAASDLTLAVVLDAPGSPAIGRDAGEALGRTTGVVVGSDPSALARADVLVDFTRPEATLGYLAACVRHRTAAVIGTTGFDEAGRAAIAAAAEQVPVVFAPNMGVGVNVTFQLLALAARILGEAYDVEIVETHHRHKVDAPSGTALGMGEVIAAARGRTLAELAVYDRHAVTGERAPGAIGFAALRGGDVVGDHTVLFAGTGERIEITHRSTSRMTYAMGSLRAARFLGDRAPGSNGLFDMQDVLGLR